MGYLAKGSDRVPGASLVSSHAGEMIGEIAVAIRNRLGLSAIATTIHAYPTHAEVFRRAADVWRRSRLTPAATRVFALWFRLTA